MLEGALPCFSSRHDVAAGKAVIAETMARWEEVLSLKSRGIAAGKSKDGDSAESAAVWLQLYLVTFRLLLGADVVGPRCAGTSTWPNLLRW